MWLLNKLFKLFKSTPKGYIKINIQDFLDTHIKGGAIPDDVFIELQNLLLSGKKYAILRDNVISSIEETLLLKKEEERALYKCAELNNIGIAAEKDGRIDEAIATYEENIKIGYKAHHAFERLMVIYRRRKDVENQKRVLLRAIEIFDPDNLNPNGGYRLRYKELANLSKPVYPSGSIIFFHVHNPVLGKQLEQAKLDFPEFEFYSRLKNAPETKYAESNVCRIRNMFKELLSQALYYESVKRYDLAAPLYEQIIAEEYDFPAPYDRLIIIYNKAGLKDDVIRVLKKGISVFTELRLKQYEYVDALAKKYKCYDFWQERVRNGKKITYYMGVFELYNPYPCVEKWQKRLDGLICRRTALSPHP